MDRINLIATDKHPNRKPGEAHTALEVHVARYIKNGWAKLADGETFKAPKETSTEEVKEAEPDELVETKPKTKATKK